MKSKISFFKFMKEEWKHHMVSLFVVVFVYLMKLLFFYFEIQRNYLNDLDAKTKLQTIMTISRPSLDAAILAAMLAVFLAAEYFSYLHSRRKSDFYLSLPVKRSQQFTLGIAVSGMLFAIPWFVELLGEVFLVCMIGYGKSEIILQILGGGGCALLAFLTMWMTTAFAMVVTGNLVIALLSVGVINLYVPVMIRFLMPLYEEVFYESYLYMREHAIGWNFFSPASLIYGLFNEWGNMEIWSQYLVAMLCYLIGMGILTIALYSRRPAEAAGQAMAFEKANTFVRFLLVIPLALYFGWFIMTMSVQDSKGWLVVGIIFGAVLFHGMIESIYRFDIHQMWTKKIHLGITIAACMGFLLYMELGEDRYHHFLPESEDLKSVEMFLNNPNMNFYINFEEADGLCGEQKEKVHLLAERVVGNEEASDGMVSFKYHLKNGRIEGRKYQINTEEEENRALLDQIFSTEDYKEDFYYVYHLAPEEITAIRLYDGMEEQLLTLTEEEKQAFLEIYKKELTEISFTDMESQVRIANMILEQEGEAREEYCPIYEQFEETCAYLEEKGSPVQPIFEEGELLSIETASEYEEEEEWQLFVDDQEILQSVKDQIVPTEFYGWDYIHRIQNGRFGTICFEKDGRAVYKDVYLSEDVVPILIQQMEK